MLVILAVEMCHMFRVTKLNSRIKNTEYVEINFECHLRSLQILIKELQRSFRASARPACAPLWYLMAVFYLDGKDNRGASGTFYLWR